jgi:2-polyprenyl-3-methyl-5-hydroxy-6-metoxy-1,4-benzoquinol methylase
MIPGWEFTACPLCGSRNEVELLTIPNETDSATFRLAKCADCDMVYLNPRPTEAIIGRYYPADYEPYQSPAADHSLRRRPARDRLAKWVLSHRYGYPPALSHWSQRLAARLAEPWVGPDRDSLTRIPFRGQGRLLDYGCGSGWFAHRMRDRGWSVVAMDFNSDSARAVENRYHLPVVVGTLPHPEIRPGSFDTITMGAVLEHVHDPNRVIAAAKEALAVGGQLVVSVPNFASWGHRILGTDWFGLDLPRHLLHFTPATLRQAIESHGFAVRDLQTQARVSWLRRGMARSQARGRGASVSRTGRLCQIRHIGSFMSQWASRRGEGDVIVIVADRVAANARAA